MSEEASGSNLRSPRECFSVGEKRIILNVYDNLLRRHPHFTVNRCIINTASLTGCSYASVRRFLLERQSTGGLHPPRRSKFPSRKGIILTEYQKDLVKQILYDFLIKNEVPTVDKVHKEVQKIEEFPAMGRTKLYEILKELRFKDGACENNSKSANIKIRTESANVKIKTESENVKIKAESPEDKTESVDIKFESVTIKSEIKDWFEENDSL